MITTHRTDNMNRSPLIAIPTRMNIGETGNYLSIEYAEAVFQAGGCPIYLPLLAEEKFIEGIIQKIDGICLSGSNSDVDPRLYNQDPKKKLGPVQPKRDSTDKFLLDFAFKYQIPLLGICYGLQILNVYLGGDLYQDLQSEGLNGSLHNPLDNQRWVNHDVIIADGGPMSPYLHNLASQNGCGEEGNSSKTMKICREFSPSGKFDFVVNSSHHQSVKSLGKELIPFSWASDGIIEAVYLDCPEHFCVGVQWHPEAIYKGCAISQAIFKAFTDASRKRSDRK